MIEVPENFGDYVHLWYLFQFFQVWVVRDMAPGDLNDQITGLDIEIGDS